METRIETSAERLAQASEKDSVQFVSSKTDHNESDRSHRRTVSASLWSYKKHFCICIHFWPQADDESLCDPEVFSPSCRAVCLY